MTSLISRIKEGETNHLLFGIYSGFIVLFCFLGIATDKLYLLGAPAFLLLAYWALADFKKVFWLLILMIPLSVEVQLGNSLATDLPTEPIMIALLGISLLWFIKNGAKLGSQFLKHPLSLLIIFHVGWTLATTIASENFIVSLKWSLAKLWYIVSFYFLVGLFIREKKDFKTFVWIVTLPLAFAIFQMLVRFGFLGFAFDKVNAVTWPFFRNHVNYAAILSVFIPFIFFARNWYPKFSKKRKILTGLFLFVLLGIYFSYTRTAYAALLIGVGTYFLIRLKLIRYAIVASIIVGIIGMFNLAKENSYLDYAPTFEKTVTHTDFGNLISATSKGEDISSMERVYRWIGGINMFRENPVMGFGPGNFYFFYKDYALNAFKTYVSNNPDRSSIHCYFLLMLCEQGLLGMLIFMAIAIYGLILGEQIYHRSNDPFYKNLVLAISLSLIIICSFLLINDMMETDKVGSFFFICMAMLARIDLNMRSKGNTDPVLIAEKK